MAQKRQRYFSIKSQLNNLVLDVQGSNKAAGTKVHTWDKNQNGSDNQLWYEHAGSCTIRSKLNDMCLEVTADGLIIRPHNVSNNNQKLKFTDNRIHVCCNPGTVLDIAASNKTKGAKVVSFKQGGQQPNQKWKLEYVDSGSGAAGPPPAQQRRFILHNDLYQRVLDVSGGNNQAGAQVIMYTRKPGKGNVNQLWYMDNNGIIHSALNDLVLQSAGADNPFTLQPYKPGNNHCQWSLKGKLIVNSNFPRQFPDVKPGAPAEGATVISKKDPQGQGNQQWRVDFV